MKKVLKRTIALILAFLPCVTINSFSVGDGPDHIPINPTHPDVNPPRSTEPECYYLDGYVYIICDISVTSISATVTRLSDNAQWSDSSTGNTLQIAVPTGSGSYRLTFSLSDGSSYYGDYTL